MVLLTISPDSIILNDPNEIFFRTTETKIRHPSLILVKIWNIWINRVEKLNMATAIALFLEID